MHPTPFPAPVVAWADGGDVPVRPLVVLLHGRGADERSILGLADHLPAGASYAALRAPIAQEPARGGGHAWFDNRGIGRPVPESLAGTMAWFDEWLRTVVPESRPVVLVGFSGGAAFAAGLLLTDPGRWAGVAVLHGTLPFEEAGVPVEPGALAGTRVFVSQGEQDHVIPAELLARTWRHLHEVSGADVTAWRDPGGHGLSPATVGALHAWIEGLLAPAPDAPAQ